MGEIKYMQEDFLSEKSLAPTIKHATGLLNQPNSQDASQEVRAALAEILDSVDQLLSSGLNTQQRQLATAIHASAQALISKANGEDNLLDGRVLLFDTESPSRESLRTIMGEWGMQVTSVAQASEFSAHLKGNGTRPNLVVIGVTQEHLDSGEFDEWLHRIDWTADYRVLIVTSGIDAKVQKRMLRGGVHACLSTPLQARAFRRTLYRLLHPNQPGGVPKPPKAPSFRRRQRPSPRILVVESDPASRQQICGFLGQKKASITLANDARDLIEQASLQTYDLVLLDADYPSGDEYECFRRIRDAELHGGATPIVVLTANLSPQAKAEFVRAGVNECLQKPVDMRTLWSCIVKWTARESAAPPAFPVAPATANGERPE
jgi:CheY-like chemotaxis protein